MEHHATYQVNMEARDHECDIQGVVNNAHYQHYFEHARHSFLKANGIDFAALAKEGINLMVQKIEIEYFAPIQAHDRFAITVQVEPLSKIRYQFHQEILQAATGKRLSRAKTTVITTDHRYRPIKRTPLSVFSY
ncbi:thioesterase family protein [Thiomicrorhabdus sp. 6S3-12]|uniref:acyl-CoA thioesterase n=1 Tax=Thiomicrorhabdus sp. 6S3-12 TaxID=2819681 RepID=UPI001AADC9EB|nr:acyl-CoA thioesterase [Thiomicrorhabdus sp. 6S3-12]MBO1923415.1 acyl-CoA thioesterase [Thiomicrorhabdus sp. 6S3-12]